MIRRYSTKSEYEKEQEEVERLSRPAPKNKPPRQDLRRNRIKVHDPDIDGEGNDGSTKDPDLSMNYKKVGRVVDRYLIATRQKREPGEVWRNPKTKSWSGKNKDGETRSGFATEEKAKNFAEGDVGKEDLGFSEELEIALEETALSFSREKVMPGEVEQRTRQKIESVIDEGEIDVTDEDVKNAVKAMLDYASRQQINADNVEAYTKYKIKGPSPTSKRKTDGVKELEALIPDTPEGRWWKDYLNKAPLIGVADFEQKLDKNLEYLRDTYDLDDDVIQNLKDIGVQIQTQKSKSKEEAPPDEPDFDNDDESSGLDRGEDPEGVGEKDEDAHYKKEFLQLIQPQFDELVSFLVSEEGEDVVDDGVLDEIREALEDCIRSGTKDVQSKLKSLFENLTSQGDIITPKTRQIPEDYPKEKIFTPKHQKAFTEQVVKTLREYQLEHDLLDEDDLEPKELYDRLLKQFKFDHFSLSSQTDFSEGQLRDLSVSSTERFMKMSPKQRQRSAEQMAVALEKIYVKDGPERQQLEAMLEGLKVASMINGERWTGEPEDPDSVEAKFMKIDLDDLTSPKDSKKKKDKKKPEKQDLMEEPDPLMTAISKACYRNGSLSDLFKTGDESIFAQYPGNYNVMKEALDNLTDREVIEALGGSDGPYKEFIQDMRSMEAGSDGQRWMSHILRETILTDAVFNHNLIQIAVRQQGKADSKKIQEKSREIRTKALQSESVKEAYEAAARCDGDGCDDLAAGLQQALIEEVLIALGEEGVDINDQENPLMVQALDVLEQPDLDSVMRALEAEYKLLETHFDSGSGPSEGAYRDNQKYQDEADKKQRETDDALRKKRGFAPFLKEKYEKRNFSARRARYLAYIYSNQNRGDVNTLILGSCRMKRSLTKKGALEITSELNKVANMMQRDFQTLGIPQSVAVDYAYRTDLLADYIEKSVGIDPQCTSHAQNYLNSDDISILVVDESDFANQDVLQQITAAEKAIRTATLKVARFGRRSMVANLTRLASVMMRLQADVVAGYGNVAKIAEVLEVVEKTMSHIETIDGIENEQESKKIARLINVAIKLARKAEDDALLDEVGNV